LYGHDAAKILQVIGRIEPVAKRCTVIHADHRSSIAPASGSTSASAHTSATSAAAPLRKHPGRKGEHGDANNQKPAAAFEYMESKHDDRRYTTSNYTNKDAAGSKLVIWSPSQRPNCPAITQVLTRRTRKMRQYN
jgi:hypothetical protein